MEVLKELGIEPGVMVVNIAGFLLLLWLLSKFAFGPIRDVISEREREIDGDIAEAEHQREAALRDRKSVEAELAAVGERGREMMAEAKQRAETAREQMVARAREQSERIVVEGRRSVDQSAEDARAQLRRETARVAIDISARALRESMDEERQAALLDAFITDVERKALEEAEDA